VDHHHLAVGALLDVDLDHVRAPLRGQGRRGGGLSNRATERDDDHITPSRRLRDPVADAYDKHRSRCQAGDDPPIEKAR
jgi:hypothetical protein